MKTCLIIFGAGLLSILSVTEISAQVYINEVHPAPTEGFEWVELYNPGPPTSLDQWWLEDQLSSPSIIHTFSEIVMPENTWLRVDLVSAKLNNTSDGVVLKNAAGTVIDNMEYSTTQPGKSWSRMPDYTGVFFLSEPTPNTSNGELPPSPSPSPTPSSTPNPTPTPSPSPSASPVPSTNPNAALLQLSEIMACPSSGDTEWLEVYNPTFEIISSTWQIRDSSNSSRVVSATISGNGFGILSWSGSLLNNTGDSLTLLTSNGQVIASAALDGCHSGESYIWLADDWQPTSMVTKGGPNIETPNNNDSKLDQLELTNSTTGTTTSSLASPTPSPQAKNSPVPPLLHSLSTQSASLYLSSQPKSPSPKTINLAQPETSKWGVINVILGGVFLLSAAGNLLHENRNLPP